MIGLTERLSNVGGSGEGGPTSFLLPIENIIRSPFTDKVLLELNWLSYFLVTQTQDEKGINPGYVLRNYGYEMNQEIVLSPD